MYVVGLKIGHRLGFLSFRRAWVQYYLLGPGVFGVAVVVFLDMVGILEGFAMPRRELPCPPATLLSEVSEHADCVSSRSKSEASLPRRLLARLPARLPARLVGRLAVFLGSAGGAQSPVSTGRQNGSTAPVSPPLLQAPWVLGICSPKLSRNSPSPQLTCPAGFGTRGGWRGAVAGVPRQRGPAGVEGGALQLAARGGGHLRRKHTGSIAERAPRPPAVPGRGHLTGQ